MDNVGSSVYACIESFRSFLSFGGTTFVFVSFSCWSYNYFSFFGSIDLMISSFSRLNCSTRSEKRMFNCLVILNNNFYDSSSCFIYSKSTTKLLSSSSWIRVSAFWSHVSVLVWTTTASSSVGLKTIPYVLLPKYYLHWLTNVSYSWYSVAKSCPSGTCRRNLFSIYSYTSSSKWSCGERISLFCASYTFPNWFPKKSSYVVSMTYILKNPDCLTANLSSILYTFRTT